MKTAAAEVLAFSLSDKQREALKIVKGSDCITPHMIEAEPLVVLCELGLVRREPLEEDRELLELTQRGRKVAEFV